jgi:DNA-binding GntR family transcriptional regulator
MILTGELLPGQKVHQIELAKQLNVSRIPLREALSTLQAEGIITHRRNSGYQVARFNGDDLEEIYLMRRLLENELLRTAELGPAQADRLEAINTRLSEVDPGTDLERHRQLNQEFHFLLFDSSPMHLVREMVTRLWQLSGFYRALYMREASIRTRVLDEHADLIAAVRHHDVEAIIRISDEHRRGTERLIVERLGRSRLA